jgi:hypothetical protein
MKLQAVNQFAVRVNRLNCLIVDFSCFKIGYMGLPNERQSNIETILSFRYTGNDRMLLCTYIMI